MIWIHTCNNLIVVVILSYNTTTANDFYIGEPLEVRCKQISPSNALLLHVVWLGQNFSSICLAAYGWSAITKGSLPDNVVYTPLTNEDCDLPNRNRTMTVKFNITDGLINLNLTCQDGNDIYSNSSLVINATKSEYELLMIV